jgi:predicted flap endonuclease-1-like 5' DNA nuclease
LERLLARNPQWRAMHAAGGTPQRIAGEWYFQGLNRVQTSALRQSLVFQAYQDVISTLERVRATGAVVGTPAGTAGAEPRFGTSDEGVAATGSDAAGRPARADDAADQEAAPPAPAQMEAGVPKGEAAAGARDEGDGGAAGQAESRAVVGPSMSAQAFRTRVKIKPTRVAVVPDHGVSDVGARDQGAGGGDRTASPPAIVAARLVSELPRPVVAARPADDLTRIRRIDKALADGLAAAGVTCFAQIANWSSDEVRRVARELDLGKRIWRENWIEQAAVLALRTERVAVVEAVIEPFSRLADESAAAPAVVRETASGEPEGLGPQPTMPARDPVEMARPRPEDAEREAFDRSASERETIKRVATVVGAVAAGAGPILAGEPERRAPALVVDAPDEHEEPGQFTAGSMAASRAAEPPALGVAAAPQAMSPPGQTAPDVAKAAAPAPDGRERPVAAPAWCAAYKVGRRAHPLPPPSPRRLTYIRGISGMLADDLAAAGVRSVGDIARWSAADVRWFQAILGPEARISADQWIEQAQVLANGQWTRHATRLLNGDFGSVVERSRQSKARDAGEAGGAMRGLRHPGPAPGRTVDAIRRSPPPLPKAWTRPSGDARGGAEPIDVILRGLGREAGAGPAAQADEGIEERHNQPNVGEGRSVEIIGAAGEALVPTIQEPVWEVASVDDVRAVEVAGPEAAQVAAAPAVQVAPAERGQAVDAQDGAADVVDAVIDAKAVDAVGSSLAAADGPTERPGLAQDFDDAEALVIRRKPAEHVLDDEPVAKWEAPEREAAGRDRRGADEDTDKALPFGGEAAVRIVSRWRTAEPAISAARAAGADGAPFDRSGTVAVAVATASGSATDRERLGYSPEFIARRLDVRGDEDEAIGEVYAGYRDAVEEATVTIIRAKGNEEPASSVVPERAANDQQPQNLANELANGRAHAPALPAESPGAPRPDAPAQPKRPFGSRFLRALTGE